MNEWVEIALAESLSGKSKDLPEPDVSAAWERFQTRLNEETEISLDDSNNWQIQDGETYDSKHNLKLTLAERRWEKMKNRQKTWVAGAVAAAVFAAVLFVPQIQTAASELLSLLRIDKVQTIELTPEDVAEVRANLSALHEGEIDLKGQGHMSIEGRHEGQSFTSLEEARLAGMVGVPELKGYKITELGQQAAFSTSMKFDLAEFKELSKQLGAEIDLDAQLDNKEFAIDFPQSSYVQYQSDIDENMQLAYGKTASPQIHVPEGVDINQVRGALLASPLFPENVRRQLASINDWESTLPIPYVEGKDYSEDVKISGASGVFIVPAEGDSHSAFLIWQADDSMHFLTLFNDGTADFETKELKKLLMDVATEIN